MPSDRGLEGQMGFFGGDHVDRGDLAAGYSCMVTCCDVPEGYEHGRFHVLPIGVFVRLEHVRVVFFTGRMRHGGTPPFAPEGDEHVDPSAYR